MAQLGDQRLNRVCVARRLDLDRPVGPVAHPAGYTKAIGGIGGPLAEEYALDASGNANMTAYRRHLATLVPLDSTTILCVKLVEFEECLVALLARGVAAHFAFCIHCTLGLIDLETGR